MHGDGKKQKLEQEEENINKEVVLLLPDVPLNTMYEILSWLPVEDILRYRCVCKTWCDWTNDPCFIELQGRRSQISRHPPFVVTIDGGRCLFHNISSNANHRWGDRVVIPDYATSHNNWWEWEGREGKELNGSIIVSGNSRWGDVEIPDGEISDGFYVASCNGFICISQLVNYRFHHTPSLVYNPITREKIRLPKFDQFKPGTLYQCGFGFDKMTNSYKLILDFYSQHVVVIITVGADHSWRMVDLPCEIVEFFRKRKRGGFFFNGGFHWLFETDKFSVGGIITLDFITEKFRTTIFSPPLQLHEHQSLLPIQLGNSIGLLHQNKLHYGRDHNPNNRSKVIMIWQILGAKPDGSCDYQFKTLNFHRPFDRSFVFQLLAVLSNGDFLFTAKFCGRHFLVLYDQQKDEPSYFVDMGFHVHDQRKYVEMGTFVPTLMSISPGGH